MIPKSDFVHDTKILIIFICISPATLLSTNEEQGLQTAFIIFGYIIPVKNLLVL